MRIIQELRSTEHAAQEFRKTVKVGDDTHCGLAIEVKTPIAKVQTAIGELWMKIAQLYPARAAPCRFVNRIYQEP